MKQATKMNINNLFILSSWWRASTSNLLKTTLITTVKTKSKIRPSTKLTGRGWILISWITKISTRLLSGLKLYQSLAKEIQITNKSRIQGNRTLNNQMKAKDYFDRCSTVYQPTKLCCLLIFHIAPTPNYLTNTSTICHTRKADSLHFNIPSNPVRRLSLKTNAPKIMDFNQKGQY